MEHKLSTKVVLLQFLCRLIPPAMYKNIKTGMIKYTYVNIYIYVYIYIYIYMCVCVRACVCVCCVLCVCVCVCVTMIVYFIINAF